MIVITAANGKLGRAVAEQLVSAGVTARLAARDPSTLADWQGRGFETVRADYDDPASLEPAFAGADILLLISGNGSTAERVRQHQAAIDAAYEAGIQRIVYTSFTNPTHESRFVWAHVHAHAETEPCLKASGITYTILRNNQYYANIDPMLAQAALSGVFAIPGASGKVAYVGHDDLASATAGALLGDGHENRIYELTGAQAFDGPDIAALLSEALGQPIASVDASPDDFAAQFRSIGLPEYLIEGLISNYAAVAAGEHAAVSNDIERLAGRPAGSLRDYIRDLFGEDRLTQ